MAILHLEPLPSRSNRGELLRFVCERGGIESKKIGRIDIRGRLATLEIPDEWQARLVRQLDGADFQQTYLRAWVLADPGRLQAEDHFGRLARLLELESDAEAEQMRQKMGRLSASEAEKSGLCLTGLVIREESSGLGGRFLLTLGKKNPSQDLPWSRLGSGSPVLLTPEGDKGDGWRGMVCDRKDSTIRVAFDRPIEDDRETPLYRLDLSTDETSRLRQRVALQQVQMAQKDRLAELRAVLLGLSVPRFDPAREVFSPRNPHLNPSQHAAVGTALAALDVAIIHGPPGTGKTTTLVEVIRQAVSRGERVLVCAPSNMAVDNLLEKLLEVGEKPVRLGHPGRVLPQLRDHTLDLMVDVHPDMRQARKISREAFQLFRKASKWTKNKPEPGLRQSQRQEARALLEDARQLESRAIERILDATPILCSTTTGLDSEIIGKRQFDLLVVDEACQSTEPGCWIPILRCQRVVLAGDPFQLPPTILSADAARQGFSVSLLERLRDQFGESITRLLTIQYRMNEQIMRFSSREFYQDRLIADDSVKNHRLTDLEGITQEILTDQPVQFIDTAGASHDEEQEPDGESRRNPEEARLAAKKVRALIERGVKPSDIAIIAPYAAQVRLLREVLDEVVGLEIDSVDGFQGREKEVVVLTLVRSNPEGDIGFLSDVRRINVAMTRARRKLLVIGDSATLANLDFYQRLAAYFEEIRAYQTVWEEID